MAQLLSNRFLSSLSPESRDLLKCQATAVALPWWTVLYEAQTTPPYAFFMTSGIASVVTEMSDGSVAEVGVIGNEGVVGSLHLLGSAKASTRCFMQMDGTALRVPFSEVQKAFQTRDDIRARFLEFIQEQSMTLAQIAGCHRLHSAEQRLARWLLMAQDRTQSEILGFTQAFLAMMLGSRRTTVTLVASGLQKRGILEYQRGQVRILDRQSLVDAACDCYPITKRLYDGLYKT
jgi:CRP-like cAMP-binding protein